MIKPVKSSIPHIKLFKPWFLASENSKICNHGFIIRPWWLSGHVLCYGFDKYVYVGELSPKTYVDVKTFWNFWLLSLRGEKKKVFRVPLRVKKQNSPSCPQFVSRRDLLPWPRGTASPCCLVFRVVSMLVLFWSYSALGASSFSFVSFFFQKLLSPETYKTRVF